MRHVGWYRQVRSRLGTLARADAPDGHRRRSDQADGARRRVPGRRRRLHRRRLQLCGDRLPVSRREVSSGGAQDDALRRGRAGGVPLAHKGRLRLRLWRHRADDAADQVSHARRLVHASIGALWWAALPRDGAAHLALEAARRDRGARRAADRRVQRGRLLLQVRGHPARTRGDARHRRRARRGAEGRRCRRRHCPLQHVRTRPL
mmetsp:Transcript_5726/g.12471  ORF Transcript_5726/g.12471 Transcript_5726/m.12471 type:complete len:205 (+) Transcript_5726:757-1371(+)